MAEEIAAGIELEDHCEAILRTVPEVSDHINESIESIPSDGDPYVTLEDLQNCQGLAIGSPTRFGNMAAPLKYFIDSSASLWLSGALEGKPATVFTSTSSLHGGQESTLLTMMMPLIHHGMIISGIPYSVDAMNNTSSGGTPYGSSHWSGNKQNKLTDEEITICRAQGTRLAHLASKLC